MRNLMFGSLVLGFFACVATPAFAGNNPEVKAAVHVRAHNAKMGCRYGTIEDCTGIVTTEPGFSFDAFPVFFNITEFKGCAYGLTWPEWPYGAAFTSCSDFVIGEIVNPGDGSHATWSACSTGVMVPGFVWLYAYSPGRICLCAHPNPMIGEIQVLDCAEGVDQPVQTFCAGVYGGTGDDPCAVMATESMSWGDIKRLFEN